VLVSADLTGLFLSKFGNWPSSSGLKTMLNYLLNNLPTGHNVSPEAEETNQLALR